MDREKIDGWCEKGILGLVLGILIFGPLALGAHGTWQFLVLQALTMGVMALWALRMWVSPSPKLLWPPICWAVLAFMLYAIVRYLQADIEYAAREELIRVLIYGFLFFAILNNLHRQEAIQIVTVTLLFLGMAISMYAVWQFFTKSQKVWNLENPYKGRAGGTFIYPNHLAGFLELLVPLGLCQVLMGRSGHVFKVVLGYASFVMLVGIGVTISRGGWAVTALTLLVFSLVMLAQRDYRMQGVVLMAVLFIAGALAVPRVETMQQRVKQIRSSGRADDLRLSIWEPAVQIWKEHFWWGAGPNHFDYRFPEFRPTSIQRRPFKAHNDYLNTLVDWGVVGTALVASAWVLLYWGIIKVWRDVRGRRDDFSRKKSNK
ncbi:MAG TPA: O-antigen ligase family protein, partial [Verrucomicrobiae bacterium]|nr:O-antigen ligase family protein [Verrucomicrobiae bacterium]